MQLTSWLIAVLSYFDPAAAPVDPAKRPVVLVHGIYSNGADMQRLARHLRAEGRLVLTPSLEPNGGAMPLDEMARQLAGYISKELPEGQFDLVGFSMGGLVARYYLQRLGGVERVSHYVTMATPHHGTWTAWLQKDPGVIQMRPGSAFLLDLAKDAEVLRQVKFTSFYTPLDTVIVPSRNSEMPQAHNVRLWAAIHPSWILDRRCLRAISAALGE